MMVCNTLCKAALQTHFGYTNTYDADFFLRSEVKLCDVSSSCCSRRAKFSSECDATLIFLMGVKWLCGFNTTHEHVVLQLSK